MNIILGIVLFIILAILINILENYNSRQSIKTISGAEEAIKEYLTLTKENLDSNQLREKAVILEKRLGLCQRIISIWSLYEQNPKSLTVLGISRYQLLEENTETKSIKWNYWHTEALEEKGIILIYENIMKPNDVFLSIMNNGNIKPRYILFFNKDYIGLSRIKKYSDNDVFGDTNKVVKLGLSGEYEDLLRFSIEKDSYKIETFHPGEWTIEFIKCSSLFNKNLSTWLNKREKLNNWIDAQKFSPDEK